MNLESTITALELKVRGCKGSDIRRTFRCKTRGNDILHQLDQRKLPSHRIDTYNSTSTNYTLKKQSFPTISSIQINIWYINTREHTCSYSLEHCHRLFLTRCRTHHHAGEHDEEKAQDKFHHCLGVLVHEMNES